MNRVSCDICVYHLGLFAFFSGVFPSSRVTGACPVTLDLIMRVNVRTTTTKAARRWTSSPIRSRNDGPGGFLVRKRVSSTLKSVYQLQVIIFGLQISAWFSHSLVSYTSCPVRCSWSLLQYKPSRAGHGIPAVACI